MTRILVPTDFSTHSRAALTQAVPYAQAVRGELLLLPRWGTSSSRRGPRRSSTATCARRPHGSWRPGCHPSLTAFAPWSRSGRRRRRSSGSPASSGPTSSSWGRPGGGASGAGSGGASPTRCAARSPCPSSRSGTMGSAWADSLSRMAEAPAGPGWHDPSHPRGRGAGRPT
jgi:hypothetical protein